LGLARAADPDLAQWIEEFVTFPNGMVDRITPATSDRERTITRDTFGIEDAAPVFCEPFRQWVLEDNFANGRPEFEAVGVTMTDSVHDYEAMKIRVLNGGHAIIAYPAGLAGIAFVHDAMTTPEIEAFLRKVIAKDVAPNVASVGGQCPEDYLEQTITRFKNPGVADTVARLCFDGTNRQPKFIVPAIRDMLATGVTPEGLALCSALWCRYCSGADDLGQTVPPNDPNWEALAKAAEAAKTSPLVWLEQEEIYGDLRQSVEFCDAFSRAYSNVQNLGALGAIRFYLAS
jgi:mannitol 2-dehydrogenase